MLRSNPRRIFLFCAGLDLAGLLVLLVLISLIKHPALQMQLPWVFFTATSYIGLGWLFGSYTVLRWRRLPLASVLQRVLITGVVTLVVVALARLLLNPPDSVWMVHRSTQAALLAPLIGWSLLMRGLLRRGVLFPPEPRVALVGPLSELQPVLEAWGRTPVRQPLRCLTPEQALELFQRLHRQDLMANVFTYNPLISTCEKDTQPEQALELFKALQRQGLEPDEVTYSCLIGASEKDK